MEIQVVSKPPVQPLQTNENKKNLKSVEQSSPKLNIKMNNEIGKQDVVKTGNNFKTRQPIEDAMKFVIVPISESSTF